MAKKQLAKLNKNPIDAEKAISAKSLTELFNIDPKKLTKEQRLLIIKTYRKERVRWVEEEKVAKAQGKKPKHSTGMQTTDIQDLLGDLDEAIADAT